MRRVKQSEDLVRIDVLVVERKMRKKKGNRAGVGNRGLV